MRRRRLLHALAAGLAAGGAGCLGGRGDGSPGGRDDGATTSTTTTASRSADSPASPPPDASTPSPAVTTVDGTELPVPTTELRDALPRDYIPAIVDPAFGADWSGLDADGRDPTLPDDTPVLGVERDGRARAYPLRILDHHEVVNDDFGGPIAVTYCVLCGSGVVFERRVAGESTTFGVSGKLWRSDLVLYDRRTDSLWSQLAATAIRGPRTGDRLEVLPSSLTTYGEWRRAHTDTRVLLPPPQSGAVDTYARSFDYFSPKYGYGDESQLVGLDSHDGGIHPKTLVVGVESDGTARAYPFHVVSREDVINDRVGELPVVVAASPDGTPVAYDRRVAGEPLRFAADGDGHLAAGDSRWERATGRAVAGPHDGTELARANDNPAMFWTGWSEFNPDTGVYGVERDEG